MENSTNPTVKELLGSFRINFRYSSQEKYYPMSYNEAIAQFLCEKYLRLQEKQNQTNEEEQFIQKFEDANKKFNILNDKTFCEKTEDTYIGFIDAIRTQSKEDQEDSMLQDEVMTQYLKWGEECEFKYLKADEGKKLMGREFNAKAPIYYAIKELETDEIVLQIFNYYAINDHTTKAFGTLFGNFLNK
jgi:hypothetical protein